EEQLRAGPGEQRIVSVAAHEDVVAGRAGQRVIAVLPEEQTGFASTAPRNNRVVAALADQDVRSRAEHGVISVRTNVNHRSASWLVYAGNLLYQSNVIYHNNAVSWPENPQGTFFSPNKLASRRKNCPRQSECGANI